MAPNKNYSRYFIILQEDEKGYGLDKGKTPSGYVKLEKKNNKCKVSYYVQNLNAEMQPYYMMLICDKKDAKKMLKLGKVMIDEYGRVDISNEYDPDSIMDSKISMDKIVGAAIVRLVDNNIISLMSGFTSQDSPKEWRSYEIFSADRHEENDYEEVEEVEEDYPVELTKEESHGKKVNKESLERQEKGIKNTHKKKSEEEEKVDTETELECHDTKEIDKEDMKRQDLDDENHSMEDQEYSDKKELEENIFDEYEQNIERIKSKTKEKIDSDKVRNEQEIDSDENNLDSEAVEEKEDIDKTVHKGIEKIRQEEEKDEEVKEKGLLEKVNDVKDQELKEESRRDDQDEHIAETDECISDRDKCKSKTKKHAHEHDECKAKAEVHEHDKCKPKAKKHDYEDEGCMPEVEEYFHKKEMCMPGTEENKLEADKCMPKAEKYVCDEEEYPIGVMGDFFKTVVKGCEPVKDISKDLDYCKWYKVPINNMESLYDMTDYDKYTVLYYPMICYYSYICKHGYFVTGYKCDSNGRLRYLVYGIPGTKAKEDQPYGGKSGFVTWVPCTHDNDRGYWLMFYDIKNSTVVIPMKKR